MEIDFLSAIFKHHKLSNQLNYAQIDRVFRKNLCFTPGPHIMFNTFIFFKHSKYFIRRNLNSFDAQKYPFINFENNVITANHQKHFHWLKTLLILKLMSLWKSKLKKNLKPLNNFLLCLNSLILINIDWC